MRLFVFSMAAFGLSTACMMAVFIYALHVPAKTAGLIESPSTIELTTKRHKDWPERWAATNMRSRTTLR